MMLRKIINNEKILTWLVFIANLLIVCFWLFNNKFFHVHDFTAASRLFDLHQALQDGHFPPRWALNFGFGYGMPLFEFYAPLTFFIAEIFHLIGFSIAISLKLTLIVITIVCFWGMYFLAKYLTNKWGALLAATAFCLTPYHAVNFYVRGAWAEYMGISLMPLVFYFSLRLCREKFIIGNFLGLVLSLSGIILSHNVTILTFLPFWLVFCIGTMIIYKKYQSFLWQILALGHSFLISAFFWLPAFSQRSYTRVDDIVQGFSQYQLHFLYFRQLFIPNWKYGGSVWGIEDDMSFYLGNDIFVIVIIAVILLTLKYLKKKIKKEELYLVIFLGLLFVISVFLTNFKSQIIWKYLPLVSFIQFPWRFLGIASFFLSLLTAYIVKNKYGKYLAVISIISIMFLNGRYFHPETLLDIDQTYNPDASYIQSRMSSILPDYLPKNIDWQKLKPIQELISIKKGVAGVEILKNNTAQINIKIAATEKSIININRFFFPNWKIYLDYKETKCQIENFIYVCEIPAGSHLLELNWSEDGINKFANVLSIFGYLVFLLLIFKQKLSSKILR